MPDLPAIHVNTAGVFMDSKKGIFRRPRVGVPKKNDQMDLLSIHTSKEVVQVNLAQCEAPVRYS